MIGKRVLAGLGALALAAGALGGTATAASAAGVGFYFSVPGMYAYPPQEDRTCWRWSHRYHHWVWRCDRPHPEITFDLHTRHWDHRH